MYESIRTFLAIGQTRTEEVLILKKTGSIAIALFLMISLLGLGGCNNKTPASERPKVNLEGRVFIVAGEDNGVWQPELNASAESDAYYYALEAIKKDLNCTIEFRQYDIVSMTDVAQAYILSGSKFADIILPTLWQTGSYIVSNALKDYKDIPNIDLSKEYWNSKLMESIELKGHQYLGFSNIYDPSSSPYALFYNKRIAAELGITDLYQSVKDGTWTHSKMKEYARIATKDIDGVAGMSRTDQWGVSCVDPIGSTSMMIFSSYGVDMLSGDGQGGLIYNMNSAPVINALTEMQKWIINDKTFFKLTQGEDQLDAYRLFQAGKALFCPFAIGYSANLSSSDMSDSWGILPFPKPDGAEDYNHFCSASVKAICVPSNIEGKELSDVGYFLDSMAFHFTDEMAKVESESYERIYPDEEDREMLTVIRDTAGIDFASLVLNNDLSNTTNGCIHRLAGDGSLSAVADISSMESAAQVALAAVLDAIPGKSEVANTDTAE